MTSRFLADRTLVANPPMQAVRSNVHVSRTYVAPYDGEHLDVGRRYDCTRATKFISENMAVNVFEVLTGDGSNEFQLNVHSDVANRAPTPPKIPAIQMLATAARRTLGVRIVK